MKKCDKVARNEREQIEEQSNVTNIKCYTCYAIKIGNNVLSRSTKEMIRIIDVENAEENYAKVKFGHKTEFIDTKARSTFKLNKITTSMTKCAHGHNHYGDREVMTSKDIRNQECLRCNERESSDI